MRKVLIAGLAGLLLTGAAAAAVGLTGRGEAIGFPPHTKWATFDTQKVLELLIGGPDRQRRGGPGVEM